MNVLEGQIVLLGLQGEIELSATAWAIVVVVAGLVALPFYSFIVAKFSGAGWTAGKVSYLQQYSRERSHNGKDEEQVH
jgi:hypothetical protein